MPYRGSAEAGTDLMGGQIDLMFDWAPDALALVRTGKVRALMIAAPSRLPDLPDVPTSTEAGYPNLLSAAWTGLVAPAGTPQPVVDRLAAAVAKVIVDPKVIDGLKKIGGQPFTGTPADFSAFVKAEVERNGAIIKAIGIKVE